MEQEIKVDSYFGRKVAVDASMSMYQFLIAMQRPDGTNMLTNDAGEVTSHINGLMMRTTKLLECGGNIMSAPLKYAGRCSVDKMPNR